MKFFKTHKFGFHFAVRHQTMQSVKEAEIEDVFFRLKVNLRL